MVNPGGTPPGSGSHSSLACAPSSIST
jgi:hypothetical protein